MFANREAYIRPVFDSERRNGELGEYLLKRRMGFDLLLTKGRVVGFLRSYSQFDQDDSIRCVSPVSSRKSYSQTPREVLHCFS